VDLLPAPILAKKRADQKMIQLGRNEPQDCSHSARLRPHGEHVWCP